jgi:hypothetical protein
MKVAFLTRSSTESKLAVTSDSMPTASMPGSRGRYADIEDALVETPAVAAGDVIAKARVLAE